MTGQLKTNNEFIRLIEGGGIKRGVLTLIGASTSGRSTFHVSCAMYQAAENSVARAPSLVIGQVLTAKE